MKIKKLLLLLVTTAVVTVSCQKEDIEAAQEIPSLQNLKISKDVLAKIEAIHLNPKDVELREIKFPNGETKQSYIIEGDIAIDAEQLENMQAGSITSKQYRTYNLVSAPNTIQIVGFTGDGQALTKKQQNALEAAVDNYNELDISLNFTLSFSQDIASADIVVFQSPGAAGGVAGFPSAGEPYGFVTIFSGMEQFSLGTNTHVMVHELGHTLGLRHTDWFTRQSCGRPSFGELANPSGAVHIPGTPVLYDPNSIMLSCFRAVEDGEFGEFDEVALEYLY